MERRRPSAHLQLPLRLRPGLPATHSAGLLVLVLHASQPGGDGRRGHDGLHRLGQVPLRAAAGRRSNPGRLPGYPLGRPEPSGRRVARGAPPAEDEPRARARSHELPHGGLRRAGWNGGDADVRRDGGHAPRHRGALPGHPLYHRHCGGANAGRARPADVRALPGGRRSGATAGLRHGRMDARRPDRDDPLLLPLPDPSPVPHADARGCPAAR